jgi:hypothetical protein
MFPPDEEDTDDAISYKKLLQLDGEFALLKDMLGFDFDGDEKTMVLMEKKREQLLELLKKWLRKACGKMQPVEFKEFESVVYKIRHAFTAVPAGKGLMTPCNRVIAKRPENVYLGRNHRLATALRDMRVLLREASNGLHGAKSL